jgi:hypothetical protein
VAGALSVDEVAAAAEERRLRVNAARNARNAIPENRAKTREAGNARAAIPENRAKTRAAARAHRAIPENRAKIRAADNARNATPENRLKANAAARARNAIPENRLKANAAANARNAIQGNREKKNAAQNARRANPGSREKTNAAQNARRAIPENREKTNAAARARNAIPENRLKVNAAANARNASFGPCIGLECANRALGLDCLCIFHHKNGPDMVDDRSGYKGTANTLYLACWPEHNVVKVGVESNGEGRRRAKWEGSGAIIVGTWSLTDPTDPDQCKALYRVEQSVHQTLRTDGLAQPDLESWLKVVAPHNPDRLNPDGYTETFALDSVDNYSVDDVRTLIIDTLAANGIKTHYANDVSGVDAANRVEAA